MSKNYIHKLKLNNLGNIIVPFSVLRLLGIQKLGVSKLKGCAYDGFVLSDIPSNESFSEIKYYENHFENCIEIFTGRNDLDKTADVELNTLHANIITLPNKRDKTVSEFSDNTTLQEDTILVVKIENDRYIGKIDGNITYSYKDAAQFYSTEQAKKYIEAWKTVKNNNLKLTIKRIVTTKIIKEYDIEE